MSVQLKIEKTLKANPQKVFEAWTLPENFSKWMGPGTVKCIKVDMDLKVGGAYEVHMQTDDGVMVALGEYKEIETNAKLAFSWGWKDTDMLNSLVVLTFEEVEGGTKMTLEQSGLPTQDSVDHHGVGWNGSFEKLEKFVG